MLSEENLKKLETLKTRYPETKPLLLPVLWMVQEQHGWISTDAMKYVASVLDLPVSQSPGCGHSFGYVWQ